jgi:hypothetical protein
MSVSDEYRLVRDSAEFLKSKIPYAPQVGISWGQDWDIVWINGKLILKFPSAYPASRAGTCAFARRKVFIAKIEDVPVIIFSGRVHYYEGHDMTEVVMRCASCMNWAAPA